MASIRKNIFSSLIGNLVYAIGQYLILILFIKFFTKAEVGEYLFALAFVTPINLGFDLQLRTLYVTESNSQVLFPDYYFFRLVTNGISILITLSAILIYKSNYFLIVLVVAGIKALETHIELLYGVYQTKYKMDFVAKSKIIRTICSITAIGITVFLTNNLIYALWSYFIVWWVLLIFYERKNVVKLGFLKRDDFKIKINKENIKYLVINTSPLIFAILIDKYYANFPRLAIEKFLGLDELAIFGSLLYFKALAGQVISAIGQATAPNLSSFFKKGMLAQFKKMTVKLIFSGFLVGLIGVVLVYFFGDWLLKIVYSAEFANYKNVLILILIGASISFSYIFIGTALTCMRKQWIKLPISLVGLALIVFLFFFTEPVNLIEVANILLYTEGLIFILYFGVYFYYTKYVFKKIDKETLHSISH